MKSNDMYLIVMEHIHVIHLSDVERELFERHKGHSPVKGILRSINGFPMGVNFSDLIESHETAISIVADKIEKRIEDEGSKYF